MTPDPRHTVTANVPKGTSADAIRWVKRFIAREIYYSLKRDLSPTG
jgi:hypothetical protein